MAMVEMLRSSGLFQKESRSIAVLHQALEGIINRGQREGKLHSKEKPA
ncbi:hypothetical protein ACX1C1_04790 [Paenibacillus sp. strain BS8-2]